MSASEHDVKIACNEPKPASIRCRSIASSARAYGRVYAAIIATGRKARGPRAFDLLIAATAAAANLPLYTRNIDDFRGLERLLTIVGV